MNDVTATVVNEERLIKRLEDLSRNQVPKAIGAALSRVGTTTRARAQRQIRQEVTLKAGVVREAIKLKRASNSPAGTRGRVKTRGVTDPRMSIQLIATGDPLPLREYQASMTKQGAKFRITKGSAREVYKRQGRVAFIPGRRVQATSLKTGRTSSRFSAHDRFGGHVFVRTGPNPPGPKQAPIKKVFGPGIAQRFRARSVQKVIRDTFRTEYPKRLRHELLQRLRRLAS